MNGKELALFCHKGRFYAVEERCPHLGKLGTTEFVTVMLIQDFVWTHFSIKLQEQCCNVIFKYGLSHGMSAIWE